MSLTQKDIDAILKFASIPKEERNSVIQQEIAKMKTFDEQFKMKESLIWLFNFVDEMRKKEKQSGDK